MNGRPFNELLKDLLEIRKMTQKTLAMETDLTESAVSHYIKGDRFPKRSTIITISNALGVSPAWLLEADFPRPPIEETFDAIKEAIIRNRHKFSKEQKLEIISLLID